MTIGIDCRMFGSLQTGIGAYIENLIKHLAEREKKINFVLFVNSRNPELPNLKKIIGGATNFKIVFADSHWYSWKEQLVFPFQIRRQKTDLMHFPHFNVPVLYRGKFVATIHDLTPKFFPGHKAGKHWWRRFAFDFVFKNAVRSASKVVAVSEYTKSEILKFYPEIPPAKISVVYEGNPFSGADASVPPAAVERLKKKYKISKPFVFYVGVWRNHKNLVGLLKAFKILTGGKKFDLRLAVGGKEDPRYPEARKAWEELGIEKDLVLPGFISPEELPVFYKAAALAVVPSFVEGFGFVGLEAMACGTPVAASRFGALPEIYGDAAVYFDPKNPEDMAEKMAEVLADNGSRAGLVKKGFERIKKYDWAKTAEQTLEIYRENL